MPGKNGKAASKYAPTTWGSPAVEEITTPSGQLIFVRKPGVEGLMKAGVVQQLDVLTRAATALDSANTSDDLNPQDITDMMGVVDKVLIYTVIQPSVHAVPEDPTQREDGFVYTDMIPLEDKLAVFTFSVGGVNELLPFRAGSDESVDNVVQVEDVPLPAE